MLFSDDRVSGFINLIFEPVWQSVRPVPTVRFDFGDKRALTRTLHGNVGTYVCAADGKVLDILPGIYTPAEYVDRLGQFRLLARYADQLGQESRARVLLAYHRGQAEALSKNEEAPRFVRSAGISKSVIEGDVATVLLPLAGDTSGAMSFPSKTAARERIEVPSLDGTEGLNWRLLAEDTRVNERIRRRQIHEMLAQAGPVRPEMIMKRLYKQVLHSDLDDPYLGLGDLLFAHYPFSKEDLKP